MVTVLVIAIMGSQLPMSLIAGRVAPGGLLIAIVWVVRIWLLGKARRDLPWHENGRAPEAQREPGGRARRREARNADRKHRSTAVAGGIFIVAAAVTLAEGVLLEESGTHIADQIGMSGVLFGSTALAASTSLPEISTGLASVKLSDYNRAISDIFGGNAFLPVLFPIASLLSGTAVLPQAQSADIYLAALGVLLTVVYMWGLVFMM